MAGQGKKTFIAGEVLTAQDVNDYLADQVVFNFASDAARSSAIPTPTEGMLALSKDTQQINYYNGSAFVSALPIGAWQSYTTTFTGVTTTSGTQSFAFCQIGKTVHVRGSFTLGASSAITGSITFTVPVTAAVSATASVVGNALFVDTGTAAYAGLVRSTSASAFTLNAMNAAGTYTTSVATSNSIPHSWGNTDTFSLTATYEAA